MTRSDRTQAKKIYRRIGMGLLCTAAAAVGLVAYQRTSATPKTEADIWKMMLGEVPGQAADVHFYKNYHDQMQGSLGWLVPEPENNTMAFQSLNNYFYSSDYDIAYKKETKSTPQEWDALINYKDLKIVSNWQYGADGQSLQNWHLLFISTNSQLKPSKDECDLFVTLHVNADRSFKAEIVDMNLRGEKILKAYPGIAELVGPEEIKAQEKFLRPAKLSRPGL